MRDQSLQLLGVSRRRLLSPSPLHAHGTLASGRINALLALNAGKTYLEIGVADGTTLEAVRAGDKEGVDPWPVFNTRRLPTGVTFHRTFSDRFFEESARQFDAVLLDGLHEFGQTYRDLCNALGHLSSRGFVILDDTVPADDVSALPNQEDAIQLARQRGLTFPRPWMGDVFRVVHAISIVHPELEYYTYTDGGRHQTVVWNRYAQTPVSASAMDDVRLGQVEFDESWSETLPDWFHPASEAEIVRSFSAFLGS